MLALPLVVMAFLPLPFLENGIRVFPLGDIVVESTPWLHHPPAVLYPLGSLPPAL